MPLNGSGTASKPAGTTAVASSTIESAKFNSVIDDIYSIFNTVRPVLYGGTGAATPAVARTALGLVIGTDVQAYDADLAALTTAFTAASASGPASLALAEDTDNGVNKVSLKAPATIAADVDLTLPGTADTLVGRATTDTLTNKTLTSPTITTPTLTLKQSATPTPTAEGDIQWDTDDNVIVVGDGAASKIFAALPASAAAGDMLYLSAAKVLTRVAKGTAAQVWSMNAGATAPEWADGANMTLLGTLTTTSGTTQSITSIPAGYRELYCEIDGVSFTVNNALSVALSSTNGAAYATAFDISASLPFGFTFQGVVRISNISSVIATSKFVTAIVSNAAGAVTPVDGVLASNTAAVVDAIRFAGGTFDAGTIRVYGVK